MPFNIVTYKYKKGKNIIWEIAIQDMQMRIFKTYEPSHTGTTEANARAKMLIYLLENELIKNEDIKTYIPNKAADLVLGKKDE